MGVVISKSTLNPLSFVSTIIGFVSFVFTPGTFLKVHAYLTNLRTELLEEKASIKIMMKQCRKYHRLAKAEGGETLLGIELDNVTLKKMDDTIKHLMKQFKELEKPFLQPGTAGIDGWKDHRHRRRTSSASPYYEHSALRRLRRKPPDVDRVMDEAGEQRNLHMTKHSGRNERSMPSLISKDDLLG